VAIALFPRNTSLDAIGPYEVLQRVPSIDVVFVGHRRGEVRSDNGMLGLTYEAAFDEVTEPGTATEQAPGEDRRFRSSPDFRYSGAVADAGDPPATDRPWPHMTIGGDEVSMRPYEIMVILDPTLDERTVAPSLEAFLNVIRNDGGKVDKVDIWGRRRLAYEIAKHSEGIYAVVDVTAKPETVSELDRQLSLNESVLRTKVLRTDKH